MNALSIIINKVDNFVDKFVKYEFLDIIKNISKFCISVYKNC